MTSIETAFADGPFGSSSSSSASETRESTKEAPPAETQTEQRDVAESRVDAKADKPATEGRDGQGDDDGELDLGELPVGSEKLYKALKSERSLTKQQRSELKATLERLDRVEAQHRTTAEQLAALQKPQTPAVEKKPEDDDDAFYNGPAAFARKVADQRALAVEDRVAQVEERFHKRLIDNSEEAYISANPESRTHIDTFKKLANHSVTGPDGRQYLTREAAQLRQQFADVVEGRSKEYRNPAQYAHDYAKAYSEAIELSDPVTYRAKVRAEIEAEMRGGTGGGEPRGESPRRTPLTLAGHRGSGASVTSAARAPTPVEKTFSF